MKVEVKMKSKWKLTSVKHLELSHITNNSKNKFYLPKKYSCRNLEFDEIVGYLYNPGSIFLV